MTEWRAISSRIQALVDAGSFFLRTNESDAHGASSHLIENAHDTVRSLQRLYKQCDGQLASEQKECLFVFLRSYMNNLMPPRADPMGFSGVTSVLTYLASFRAEFDYLLRDNAAVVRSLVERALVHLQRTLVVDGIVQSLWKTKFDQGETACEALGACHLLLHGVWAFKTSAKGERTDLVLGEPLDTSLNTVQRVSVGLILTEWKVVSRVGELEQKLQAAYQQAKRYCQGILAGFEVSSPRYLIIVSADFLTMPEPRQEEDVTYEYQNIAICPSSPSKAKQQTSNGVNLMS
jgi:hypothetical protein